MDILKSKKFQATIVGLIVVLMVELIPALDEVSLTAVVTPIVAYIVGQGIADHGKEAELVRKQPIRMTTPDSEAYEGVPLDLYG